jgi:hypothetical protein
MYIFICIYHFPWGYGMFCWRGLSLHCLPVSFHQHPSVSAIANVLARHRALVHGLDRRVATRHTYMIVDIRPEDVHGRPRVMRCIQVQVVPR